MGLGIQVNVQIDKIDDERWEAAWLTSLQLLEEFPVPLASLRTIDHRAGGRTLYSSDILFDAGTTNERWEVVGDLASRRMAETYKLHRRLSQATQHARQNQSNGKDILWSPTEDSQSAQMSGTQFFGDKSQGYPYHYAMLAVGVLWENSFPNCAVVHGDINRLQAEKIRDWAESILRRPLALPVVTNSERLWPRLRDAYVCDELGAVQRFLKLICDGSLAPWQALLSLKSGPDVRTLRRIFRDELRLYKSLDQRGAMELIQSVYQARADLDLLIDWICIERPDDSGKSFPPVELLTVLCEEMITVPLESREIVHEFIQASSDPMPNIDSEFGRTMGILAGAPVVIDAYLDQESLLAPFSRNWPHRTEEFRTLIHDQTEKTWAIAERTNSQLAEMKAERLTKPVTPRTMERVQLDLLEVVPEAEFILHEIRMQRFNDVNREELARGWGAQFRLAMQDSSWDNFAMSSPSELLEWITRASRRNNLILTESAWNAIDAASHNELKLLLILAGLSDREISRRIWQIHLLESPDLWHHLTSPGE